jgi:ribosomal protein S12
MKKLVRYEKSTVTKCLIVKRKKRSSSNRKVVQLNKSYYAYVRGDLNSEQILKVYNSVLVMRKGRSSLVLISGTVLRGVLDCRSVVNRTTSRSQYGIKKIRNERTSCDEVVKSKNIPWLKVVKRKQLLSGFAQGISKILINFRAVKKRSWGIIGGGRKWNNYKWAWNKKLVEKKVENKNTKKRSRKYLNYKYWRAWKWVKRLKK